MTSSAIELTLPHSVRREQKAQGAQSTAAVLVRTHEGIPIARFFIAHSVETDRNLFNSLKIM